MKKVPVGLKCSVHRLNEKVCVLEKAEKSKIYDNSNNEKDFFYSKATDCKAYKVIHEN